MGVNKALASAPWRIGDASSRLLLDVAAGRPLELHRPLTDDEMELAAHHGLIGLMAGHDDPYLRAPAVALYARLAARQGVMRTHLHRILTELHASGIKATVLKGLHLAEWAYANPAHRTTTDIDLLVPADQVERTLEILEGDEAVQTIPPKTPKADKRNILLADDSGMRFTLDLHWDLFSYTQLRGCADGATEWAWDRATFDENHPLGPMWVLPEGARIAFLCTHALLDHRFRLILFRDLAEVAATDPDWDALVAFAERWKLRSTTYLALLMAAGLMGSSVPQRALEMLRSSGIPLATSERMLPGTDIVRFDGHRPHLLNLSIVLVHDERTASVRLALQAPVALPGWFRRVEPDRGSPRQVDARSRPPSLLIVISSDRRRGAEVFGERLAIGLAERGWDTELVALTGGRESPRVNASALTTNRRVHRFDLGMASTLRGRVRRTRPDVVLANGGATLRFAVAALSQLRRAPRLAYTSIGEPAYWIRGRVHRWQQALLHRRVDLILAISMMTKKQLIELLGVESSKVEVAYTGVPQEFLVERQAVDGLALHLIFLGNLSTEKDPHQALELVRNLAAETDVEMHFVGGGPLLEDLKERAVDLGVAERVVFTGSVENVQEHIEWADILVLTSRTEGFPGVVLEAAAAGVPAVVYDVGGANETVIDGVTGMIVPPGDLAGMAARIRDLDVNRGNLHMLGAAARERVKSEFLLHHAIDRYDRLLRTLLVREAIDIPQQTEAEA